jgi:sporulation protein YlmC with PRC-barrel domain
MYCSTEYPTKERRVTDDETAGLVKLSDENGLLLFEYADEDVRGREVYSLEGEKIGHVDDVLVDPKTVKARFLVVNSGGFLGIGVHTTLIPIEAVSGVDANRVTIEHVREHIAAAPVYDPHFEFAQPYLYEIYEHYGHVPGAGDRKENQA